jgi:high-affinity Fe2+/Pb2+ permease
MFVFARDKEKERYYLFAGMGGKAKRRTILAWSMAAGAVASLLLAWALYWLSQRR